MRKQRVFTAARLGILDVRPAPHEVAMGHDAREFAGDGAVDGLCDAEVGGEQYIKIALVNLFHPVSWVALDVFSWL
jgi:hypothetical protein